MQERRARAAPAGELHGNQKQPRGIGAADRRCGNRPAWNWRRLQPRVCGVQDALPTAGTPGGRARARPDPPRRRAAIIMRFEIETCAQAPAGAGRRPTASGEHARPRPSTDLPCKGRSPTLALLCEAKVGRRVGPALMRAVPCCAGTPTRAQLCSRLILPLAGRGIPRCLPIFQIVHVQRIVVFFRSSGCAIHRRDGKMVMQKWAVSTVPRTTWSCAR